MEENKEEVIEEVNENVEVIAPEEKEVEEQPVVVNEPVENNNNDKKGNNKKLILIISLIAASLVVIGAVVLFLVLNNREDDSDDDYYDEPETTEVEDDKKETTEEENKKEEKKDDNKEEQCNRSGKDKSEEVQKILGKAYLLDTIYSYYLFANNKYEYSEISDAAKFYIAIRNVEPPFEKSVRKDACIDYKGQQICNNFEVISFSSVKQAYKDIFGIECNVNESNLLNLSNDSEKRKSSLPNQMGCPSPAKIENDDLYLAYTCGGTYGEGMYGDYVYDYKKNDTTVEVYVAVAYWKYQNNDTSKTTIYKDYEFKNAYKNDISWTDCIKIDKDNYDEFSKFKVIYEKNSSGKYIFKSSERISSGK